MKYFSAKDVAQRFKIAPYTARDLLLRVGIPVARQRGNTCLYEITDELWQVLADLKKQPHDSFDAADIAGAAGCSMQTAYLAIRELGLEPVQHGRDKYYSKEHFDAVIARIKSPHQRGPKAMWSAQKLAQYICQTHFQGYAYQLWDEVLVAKDIIARAEYHGIEPDGDRSLNNTPAVAWLPENAAVIASWYGVKITRDGGVRGEEVGLPDPYDDVTADGDGQFPTREQWLSEQTGMLPVKYIEESLRKVFDTSDPEIEAEERRLAAEIEESNRRKQQEKDRQKKMLDDLGY